MYLTFSCSFNVSTLPWSVKTPPASRWDITANGVDCALLLAICGMGVPSSSLPTELLESLMDITDSSTAGSPGLSPRTLDRRKPGVRGTPFALLLRDRFLLVTLFSKGVNSPCAAVAGKLRRSARGARVRGVLRLSPRPLRNCEMRSSLGFDGDANEFSIEKFSKLCPLAMYVVCPASVPGVSIYAIAGTVMLFKAMSCQILCKMAIEYEGV